MNRVTDYKKRKRISDTIVGIGIVLAWASWSVSIVAIDPAWRGASDKAASIYVSTGKRGAVR